MRQEVIPKAVWGVHRQIEIPNRTQVAPQPP